ncbi:hypothetical protein WA171_004972 [Blastocystis sp. BT1]
MSATTFNVIANLVKTCIGTGMLALPNTVYLGGLIPAIVILIVVPSWIVYCTKLITDSFCAFDTKPKPEEDPYVLLADKAFGKVGVLLLQISFVITVYGIAVAYEITWNMLLAGLNWKQWGLEFFSNKWFWGVVYFFLACILALLKDLRALAKPSQMGNFFIITVSIIVIIYGICSFGLHIDTKNLMWTTPLDLAKLFGVVCYSLGIAVIGPTSYNTMKKPEQYFKALVTSVVIAVLVYMSLGVLGAMSYNRAPGGIDPLVINNIPSSNIIYYICCIGICFVAYFSYPVAVFPGILALESGIKESEEGEGYFVKNWKRIVLRIFMTLVVTVISIVFPNFKGVVSLIGCLTISFVTFVFPPLIHYVLVPQTKGKQIRDIILAMLG